MRKIAMVGVAAFIGLTAAACTDDSYYGNQRYYGTGTRTQYVYGPSYAYTPAPAYSYSYGSSYSRSSDWDRDGVPNWRDSRPQNPYRY
jgi:hypothetical protein